MRLPWLPRATGSSPPNPPPSSARWVSGSHADQDIEWVDDALPELAGLREQGRRFDLILLAAVWMHLDERQRSSAMAGLAGLLNAAGRVILSLRHGPVPVGRRMFPVSAEETIDLARGCGLEVILLAERDDLHGRRGVTWTSLGLQAGTIRDR